jgi:hypothetical protein
MNYLRMVVRFGQDARYFRFHVRDPIRARNVNRVRAAIAENRILHEEKDGAAAGVESARLIFGRHITPQEDST